MTIVPHLDELEHIVLCGCCEASLAHAPCPSDFPSRRRQDPGIAFRSTELPRRPAWDALPRAVLPFLVLEFWRLSWGPDASMGDYAQYLLHARALLEGRSYGDVGYLVHAEAPDLGPVAYPPGFPLALLPIRFYPLGIARP